MVVADWVALEAVREREGNPRKHDLEAIARSIERFGFAAPLVLDRDGILIAGHGRLAALRLLQERGAAVPSGVKVANGTWRVRCVRVPLTGPEAIALAAADNRVHDAGGYEWRKLVEQLGVLSEELRVAAGYDANVWEWVQARAAGFVPRMHELPDARVAGTWRLGRHVLVCGDAGDPRCYERLEAALGRRADLVWTSPPYPLVRSYEGREVDWPAAVRGLVMARQRANEHAHCVVNLGIVYHKGFIYRYWDELIAAMERAGWGLKGWYVWAKSNYLGGSQQALSIRHEWLLDFTGAKVRYVNRRKSVWKKYSGPQGGPTPDGKRLKCYTVLSSDVSRYQSIIRAPIASERTGHPAPFSVKLSAAIIRRFGRKHDVVLDPFVGAGTTIIAAEQMGCIGAGIDIEPRYIATTVQRWEKLTGQRAEQIENA